MNICVFYITGVWLQSEWGETQPGLVFLCVCHWCTITRFSLWLPVGDADDGTSSHREWKGWSWCSHGIWLHLHKEWEATVSGVSSASHFQVKQTALKWIKLNWNDLNWTERKVSLSLDTALWGSEGENVCEKNTLKYYWWKPAVIYTCSSGGSLLDALGFTIFTISVHTMQCFLMNRACFNLEPFIRLLKNCCYLVQVEMFLKSFRNIFSSSTFILGS